MAGPRRGRERSPHSRTPAPIAPGQLGNSVRPGTTDSYLVLDAKVAVEVVRGEEAQRVQAVVDGHHHHVTERSQVGAVVQVERTAVAALCARNVR